METDRSLAAKEAAVEYIKRGLQVVPLADGTKACNFDGWTSLVFAPEDFQPGDNIGIRQLDGLVDIDCDAPEIVGMATKFLPATGAVYGRLEKPHSHWLYKAKFDKTIAFADLCTRSTEDDGKKKKSTLIEIRVNHQSMAPPSIHPDTKEILEWVDKFGEPADIKPEDLLRAVRLLATAGLLARNYNPPGNRHDWGLAVAGALHQLGVDEPETRKIFEAAMAWVHDPDPKNRFDAIKSTYAKTTDDPLRAGASLKDLMVSGKEFVKSLNLIWGATSASFIMDDKGERIIKDSQENIARALKKLNVVLRFNEFTQKPEIGYGNYAGELEDPVRNRLWLEIDKKFHFRPSPEFFDVVIQDIAYSNPYHPVRDYLTSVKWDKTPRIDTWLIRSAKAADTPYVRTVSSLTLIAAVKRVMHPGCKFDELMVLESQQGQMKSTVLKTLCPDESWFSDDLPLNVDAKQIIERTTGKWIIEAAELSGMKPNQTEHLKAMLSRQVDGPVRLAYARLPKSQYRQFVIVGTTNSHNYLDDATGNRRFWPLRIENFDIDLVRRERDQLWAEATFREAAGESIRMAPELYGVAAIQQERRRTEHPWESVLVPVFENGVHRVTPDEIWEQLGVPVERRTAVHQKQVSSIMQQMGFRKMAVKNKAGHVVKGWGKGDWARGVRLPMGGVDPRSHEGEDLTMED